MLLVVLVRPEAHSGNQNESLARKENTGDDRGSGRTPQKAGYKSNDQPPPDRRALEPGHGDPGSRIEKGASDENSSGNVHRR